MHNLWGGGRYKATIGCIWLYTMGLANPKHIANIPTKRQLTVDKSNPTMLPFSHEFGNTWNDAARRGT
jgi:hypothetical protein